MVFFGYEFQSVKYSSLCIARISQRGVTEHHLKLTPEQIFQDDGATEICCRFPMFCEHLACGFQWCQLLKLSMCETVYYQHHFTSLRPSQSVQACRMNTSASFHHASSISVLLI